MTSPDLRNRLVELVYGANGDVGARLVPEESLQWEGEHCVLVERRPSTTGQFDLVFTLVLPLLDQPRPKFMWLQ